MRLRLTIVCEYSADPEPYGTDSPTVAAAIDEGHFEEDISHALWVLENNESTVTVEPVND